TTIDKSENGHYWPAFLPDGRRFLYSAWSVQPADRAIWGGAFGSNDKTRVIASESNAAMTDPGLLVYSRGGTVYAQRFDEHKLAVSGEPARVADDVMYEGGNGRSHFSLSRNGVLVYFFSRSSAVGSGPSSDMSE